MSFYDRFELLELFRDDSIKTFQARETATGRPVQVHLFVHPKSPESQALLHKLDRLNDAEKSRILDRGEHEGTPYVVTDRLVEFAGFREWLVEGSKPPAEHAAGAEVPSPSRHPEETEALGVAGAWKVVAQPVVEPSPAVAGDSTMPAPGAVPPEPPPSFEPDASAPAPSLDTQFARLFQTGQRSAIPAVAPPSPPENPVTEDHTLEMPIRSEDAGPIREGPGEFTRMFQSPAQPAPPKQPGESPSRGNEHVPGEFTKMFEAQAPPTPVPIAKTESPPVRTSPAPPAAKSPGEFTRMFEGRPASEPAPPQRSAPKAQAPTPAAAAGEFTRMVQAQASASPPQARPADPSPSPPDSHGAKGPGEFTRFFQSPGSSPLPASPAVHQPLNPQQPGTAGPNKVGEFTRVFGKGDAPAAAPTPPPESSTSSPTGGATKGFAVPVPAHAPRPEKQGPGEYTQMFSAPAPLTLGQPELQKPDAPRAASSPLTSSPPAGTAPKSKSYLPLILGGVAVLILIVVIVAFFFLRPK